MSGRRQSRPGVPPSDGTIMSIDAYRRRKALEAYGRRRFVHEHRELYEPPRRRRRARKAAGGIAFALLIAALCYNILFASL